MEAATALKNVAPTQAPDQAKPDGVEKARAPSHLWVVDKTAVEGRGERKHEMIVDGLVKAFSFEPGKPTKLPFAVAIKFLRIPEFVRTDEKGNPEPYTRQPKQPHEMAAGEKFELKDNQTVADYAELSNMALWQRCLELPGGEKLPQSRDLLIKFLIDTTIKRRKETVEKKAAEKADAGEAELTDIEAVDDSDFN